MTMSPTHCDIMQLPRQHHIPIVTPQWVFTVMPSDSDMEYFTYYDDTTTNFTSSDKNKAQ